MKLYSSHTSPYARIIMLAALAAGKDEIELAWADPWLTPPELTAINPLSQVPALLTDDGVIIANSPFIIDYLFDHPLRGARATALAGYGFALLDQVVKAYSLNRFKPGTGPEHPHIERARQAVVRGAKAAPQLDAQSTAIGHLALGLAFSYLQLRLPDLYPSLSDANRAAFERFQPRPDVRAVAIANLEKHPATIGALRAFF